MEIVPQDPIPPEQECQLTRLFEMGADSRLSIESVKLKFTDGGSRSVYGTIYINTSGPHVYTVYKRTSNEAEMIAARGGELTLCGPRYSVLTYGATTLFVDLYVLGHPRPFLHQKVEVQLGTDDNISCSTDAGGGRAVLTVDMTPIMPCAYTEIFVSILYPDSYADWLVHGTVTAIQTLVGGTEKRQVTLFKRSMSRAVRPEKFDLSDYPDLHPGKHKAQLILDRSTFLAPLLFEKDFVKEIDQARREAGFLSGLDPDNDMVNGVGSSVRVEFDLSLVSSADDGVCHRVCESLDYVFKGSHPAGAAFRSELIPNSDDQIKVLVCVQPTCDMMSSKDEEPFRYAILDQYK